MSSGSPGSPVRSEQLLGGRLQLVGLITVTRFGYLTYTYTDHSAAIRNYQRTPAKSKVQIRWWWCWWWWSVFTFFQNFIVRYYGAPPHPLSGSVPQHFLLSWSWNIKTCTMRALIYFRLSTWDCLRVMLRSSLCHPHDLVIFGSLSCSPATSSYRTTTTTRWPSLARTRLSTSAGSHPSRFHCSIEDLKNLMSKYIWSGEKLMYDMKNWEINVFCVTLYKSSTHKLLEDLPIVHQL